MSAYPPNVHILRRPELEPDYKPPTPENAAPRSRSERVVGLSATQFPEPYEVFPPSHLIDKSFGCSGSMETTYRYQEATKYRALRDMDWAEARLALRRLVAAVGPRHHGWRYTPGIADYLALAEFALTAQTFDFAGRKGDVAPKFRTEVANAISNHLLYQLSHPLNASAKNIQIITRPITDLMRTYEPNDALKAMVPLPDNRFVMVMQATSEEAVASLEYLRRRLADRVEQRAFAEHIAERLRQPVSADEDGVTAKDYASAISIATETEFISSKLVMLYSGIRHSIPLYRLYPATPEREAISLWWPWGRAMPLVDGGPAKPQPPRKRVLDPSIIKATRPQDVVREVIERTGINRTTAQRMTAEMRADMRRKREALAVSMLRKGETQAAVARALGLSPSRVSAMFKGRRTEP